jgi:hypothetical protein
MRLYLAAWIVIFSYNIIYTSEMCVITLYPTTVVSKVRHKAELLEQDKSLYVQFDDNLKKQHTILLNSVIIQQLCEKLKEDKEYVLEIKKSDTQEKIRILQCLLKYSPETYLKIENYWSSITQCAFLSKEMIDDCPKVWFSPSKSVNSKPLNADVLIQEKNGNLIVTIHCIVQKMPRALDLSTKAMGVFGALIDTVPLSVEKNSLGLKVLYVHINKIVYELKLDKNSYSLIQEYYEKLPLKNKKENHHTVTRQKLQAIFYAEKPMKYPIGQINCFLVQQDGNWIVLTNKGRDINVNLTMEDIDLIKCLKNKFYLLINVQSYEIIKYEANFLEERSKVAVIEQDPTDFIIAQLSIPFYRNPFFIGITSLTFVSIISFFIAFAKNKYMY